MKNKNIIKEQLNHNYNSYSNHKYKNTIKSKKAKIKSSKKTIFTKLITTKSNQNKSTDLRGAPRPQVGVTRPEKNETN